MCLPDCTIQLAHRLSRRTLLRNATVAAAATLPAVSHSPADASEQPPASRLSVRNIVDLTHALGPNFPFPVPNAFNLERISSRPKDMWNINRWHFHEHIGTHIDAPFHCSDGDRSPTFGQPMPTTLPLRNNFVCVTGFAPVDPPHRRLALTQLGSMLGSMIARTSVG